MSLIPCGWSRGRIESHQVHHVDHSGLQPGQPVAQDLCRRDGLHGDDVARTGEHDVRFGVPSSLPAQGQMPAPRAQCRAACSIESYCNCGCLSITIKFTYDVERRQWSATDSRQLASGGR